MRALARVSVRRMAPSFVLGGIFPNGLSGAVAVLIGFTGLVGGVGRYGATLLGLTPSEIDRATALGFFGGLGVGFFAVLIESTA
jgi:hypothetical protein